MKRYRARFVAGLVAALILFASAAAHALVGWPAMRSALEDLSASPDLLGALGVGWTFGSVSMLAFGCIVLLWTLRLRREPAQSRAPLWAIAACYVAFGAGAMIHRGGNPHFLLFVITGVLVALPALPGSRLAAGARSSDAGKSRPDAGRSG